jgi:hypothetical protein
MNQESGEIPGWKEYQKTKIGTPKEIASGFCWATHFSELPQVQKDIDIFLKKHPDLPLNAEKLTKIVASGYQLIEEVWKALFPFKNPLPYHNLDHGKNTGLTALELFLGAVAQHQLSNLPNLETLIHTFFIAGLLHEIDDWWNLEAVKKTKGYDLEKAKKIISDYLKQNRLPAYDFNRFLKLNQFNLTPEESIAQARTLSPQEGFLPQNEIPSAIEGIAVDQQKLLWEIFEDCLGAADFLQIINLAYIQKAEIIIGKNRLQKICGSVVLAEEWKKVRPKALANIGWGTEKGKIYWKKVKMGKSFLEKALKRIKTGLEYLKNFDPIKHQRAQKCLEILSYETVSE